MATYTITVDNCQLTVDKTETPCTGFYDVYQLMEVKSVIPHLKRNFALYKSRVLEGENTVYYLLLSEDKFPVIISEEYAKEILEDPEKGVDLAFNIWLTRYR